MKMKFSGFYFLNHLDHKYKFLNISNIQNKWFLRVSWIISSYIRQTTQPCGRRGAGGILSLWIKYLCTKKE